MLTDCHGRANQSYALWEQRISSKAWALSVLVVPHFFLSPRAASRLSSVGWFSRTLALRSLYYPWGKRTTRNLTLAIICAKMKKMLHGSSVMFFFFFAVPCCFKRYFASWTFDSCLEVVALKGFFDLWYRQQHHHHQHNIIERIN